MPAALLVPLGERRRHVHLLDDVTPADAGVVRAEGDVAVSQVGSTPLASAKLSGYKSII
jgi:hypothetical protein